MHGFYDTPHYHSRTNQPVVIAQTPNSAWAAFRVRPNCSLERIPSIPERPLPVLVADELHDYTGTDIYQPHYDRHRPSRTPSPGAIKPKT